MSINDKLDNIIKSLEQINERLEILENSNDSIKENCNKMSEHIDFIEDTYQSLRTPLGYLKNRVNYILGIKNDHTVLPTLEDKK